MTDTYRLPTWVFKPSKPSNSSSTTVSAFDPELAVKGATGAFQSRMLATVDETELEKMTLLINDPTLQYLSADHAVEIAHALHRLITRNFAVYIIYEGKSLQLESTQMMSQGDELDEQIARDILVKDTGIPADDIVVCDYHKSLDLVEQLNPSTKRWTDVDIKYFCLIYPERTSEIILNQWNRTKTIPYNIEAMGPIDSTILPDKPQLCESVMNSNGLIKYFEYYKFEPNSRIIKILSKKLMSIAWDENIISKEKFTLPELEHASIWSYPSTDKSIIDKILGDILTSKRLKSLWLKNNSSELINENISRYLIACDFIESLSLNNIGDIILPKMNHLQNLAIRSDNLSGDFLMLISRLCPQLTRLELNLGSEINHNFTFDSNAFSGLKSLHLILNQSSIEFFWKIVLNTSLLEHLELQIEGQLQLHSSDFEHMNLRHLTTLNISSTALSETTLVNLLRCINNVRSVSIRTEFIPEKTADWSGISLPHVKKLDLRSCKKLSYRLLENLSKAMPGLEELDCNSAWVDDGVRSETLDPNTFKNLKNLDAVNSHFGSIFFHKLLPSMNHLQFLSIGSLHTLDRDTITLDRLENITVSHDKIAYDELTKFLKKSQKLISLKLYCCDIYGGPNFTHSCKDLIIISMKFSKIDTSLMNNILSGSAPILLDLSQSKLVPEDSHILSNSTFEEFNKDRLIKLDLGMAIEEKPYIGNLFDWGKNLRSVNLPSLSSIDTSTIKNALPLKLLYELELHEENVPDEILAYLPLKLPNLHRDCFHTLMRSSPSFQNQPHHDRDASKNQCNFKDPKKVYDHKKLSICTQLILNSQKTSVTYEMVSFFTHQNGPLLSLVNIRSVALTPLFSPSSYELTFQEIPVELDDYDAYSETQTNDSVYQRNPYRTYFQDPCPDLNLHDPWIRLDSLSSNDRLIDLKFLEGLDSQQFQTKRCKKTRFYYLILKPNTSCPPSVMLSYRIIPHVARTRELPENLQAIKNIFLQKYQVGIPESIEILPQKEMFEKILQSPVQADCEKRALAFLWAIKYQINSHSIQDNLFVHGPSHAWVEIKINDVWITVDLGGEPTPEIIVDNDEILEFENRNIKPSSRINRRQQSARMSQPSLKAPNMSLQNLTGILKTKRPNTNILLITKDDGSHSQINQIRRRIRLLNPEHTTVIDHYHMALNSVPYLKLRGEGWEPVMSLQGPEGWLVNQFSPPTPKQNTLLVDWSSMTSSEATKLNGCIDLNHRQCDGLTIDSDVMVISLINDTHLLLKDSSFLSRHRSEVYYVHESRSLEPMVTTTSVLSIELYHSSQWKKIILGKLGFDQEGTAVHLKNDLLLLDKPHHIIINNPPGNCNDFHRFIDDLRDGHAIKYFDRSIALPRMKVTLTHKINFSELTSAIAVIHINSTFNTLMKRHIDHVITPNTFERCIQTNRIINGKLITTPGWLKSASTQSSLSLFITRSLSEEQIVFLLKDMPQGSLTLYLAPGVKLPHELERLSQNLDTTSTQSLVKKLKTDHEPPHRSNQIVIDVSELTPDDLFYGYDYLKNPQHNHFEFKEKISDVWKKLEAGAHIVLKGYFSPELIDHLSSLLIPNGYLWHDGKQKTFSGTLHLQPSHPIESLTWANPKIFLEDPLSDQPDVSCQMLITKEADRMPTLLHVLESRPYVFIEGVPGIGKSCFLRSLKSNSHLKCYTYDSHDFTAFTEWASADDPRLTLLLIDEATIRGTDWSVFEGLKTPGRTLLIDKQLYKIKPQNKVVFLGNRLKKMPAFIDDKFPTLVFDQLSREEVIKNILVPIFAEIDPATAERNAQNHYDPSVSLRELQAAAIDHYAKQKSFLAPPAFDLSYPRELYFLPDSRKPLAESLKSMINARRFMREASADSARFGGKTGQLLIGPAGIGKSEIIHATLHSMSYRKAEDLSQLACEHLDQSFTYYHIPASCSLPSLRNHLKHAFQQGCIVMIDELDAILKSDTPSDEIERQHLIAELNAYLMGENLQGDRPKQPGFMLMATGNGIAYHGRAPIPESLGSRLKMHQINPYPYDDCKMILKNKYPEQDSTIFDSLIHKYLNNPKAYSFRHLLHDCKVMVENAMSHSTQVPLFLAYQTSIQNNVSVTQNDTSSKLSLGST